ncbi:MAG: hypothetical protein U0T77_03720 [Chitinophagales bacterium]
MKETVAHTTFYRKLPQVLGALLLLVIGIKWSIGLSRHMDILFGDEAEYMRNGLDLFHVIRNDWGPAYNIWYKFLSFFFSDTIQLYYANYIIGGIAVAVLLFIALSSLRIHYLTALYISFCFFVSSVNINTWPRVSHFVLLMVLGSIIFISKLNSAAKKCLTFSILLYICSYARPDLFIAFLVVLSLSVFFMYREKENLKSFLPYLLVLLLAVLFFQLIFGFPSPTYKGGLNRLYSAFCQHYTMNYKYRTGAHFDAVTEWIEFCKSKFPDCLSITDVIKKHPGEFAANLFFNIRHYLLLLFTTSLSFIFPTGIFTGKKAMLVAIILFLSAFGVISFHKEKRSHFIHLLNQHKLLLFFLFVFGLPSIGMSIIIFPRPHYILLHSLLLVFILALVLQSIFHTVRFNYRLSVGIGLLLLLIAPDSSAYRYMQFGKDMDNLCEQKLIRYLESKKDKPYMVFTNYLNITYILPKNYTEFSTEFELKRGMTFSSVLNNKHVNVILVSSNILENPILKEDTTWNDLMMHPEKYNFKTVKYSDICESYLLIKE